MLGNTHGTGLSLVGAAIVAVANGAISSQSNRGITVAFSATGIFTVTIDQGVAPNFADQLQVAQDRCLVDVTLRDGAASATVVSPIRVAQTSPSVKTITFPGALGPVDPDGF